MIGVLSNCRPLEKCKLADVIILVGKRITLSIVTASDNEVLEKLFEQSKEVEVRCNTLTNKRKEEDKMASILSQALAACQDTLTVEQRTTMQ